MQIAHLLFLIFSSTLADELISTRCQSQCLNLMDSRLQANPEHRKNLKHHIIQMCKDDDTCSACSTPCREPFENLEECRKSCGGGGKTAEDRQTCEASCEHLNAIYSEKPGTCPKPNANSTNYECSAQCQLDGDCPETQKCCTIGCSRQCVRPRSTSATHLPPIPTNISVQERKRKRSIIIRWSAPRVTHNSHLFLVQWRWGLHTDERAMTDWQTVTVRNKPNAILKHLLSPGRFYQFRIAAVSPEGSLGFSAPSAPFKISKEARAPPPPKDLSLGAARLTPIGLWTQLVQWSAPASDLPIKNYQISWAVSSGAEADAFEDMMRRRTLVESDADSLAKRSLTDGGEADEWEIQEDRDRNSAIIPSHSTSHQVSGLFPNSVYIVEVHASVDSTDGELHGEKGVIFIRTGDIAQSESESAAPKARIASSEEIVVEQKPHPSYPTHTPLAPPNLEIGTPTFENQQLQTTMTWHHAEYCQQRGSHQFLVRIRKTLCREYQPDHHSDTRWHDLEVDECSAILKGLSFDCDYKVEISDLHTFHPIVDGVFSTDPCETTTTTSSSTPLDCSTLTTPIQCHVSSETSAHCHWTRHHATLSTIIGYRILLSSAVSHDDTNTTINRPQTREVRYENLRPGHVYTIEVQSITTRGLGHVVSTQFVTHATTRHQYDTNVIERFPGGEIIELPLESQAPPLFLILPLMVVFLRLF